MRNAVIYARVACEEQLVAQVNMLRRYADSRGFRIVEQFRCSKSANQQGRKHLNAMLEYLRQHPDVRVVIVEKTDRLCRNLQLVALVEDTVNELGLEVHFVKEGQVLRKESNPFAVMARNYILNLQEEILKGQIVKAEKGQYPGRAVFGYSHDRGTRTIVAHPSRAGIVKLIFELYSTGRYSVETLINEIIRHTGEKINKSHLQRILKSRFYLGLITWCGREYRGVHPPLVDTATFERVRNILTGRSKGH